MSISIALEKTLQNFKLTPFFWCQLLFFVHKREWDWGSAQRVQEKMPAANCGDASVYSDESWIIMEFLEERNIGCYFLKHLFSRTAILSEAEWVGRTSGSSFIDSTNIDLVLYLKNRFSPQSLYIIASLVKGFTFFFSGKCSFYVDSHSAQVLSFQKSNHGRELWTQRVMRVLRFRDTPKKL